MHIYSILQSANDNYPKENFEKIDNDGKSDSDSIPPTDGAFIIKDSYGETGGFDAKGTFYISYHDHTFLDPTSFEFDKTDSVKYTDLNYDQYDMLFIGWCGSVDFDGEAKTANVFDAEEDEYLYQISYRTKVENTSVHYAVYKDVQDGSPDAGTLLEEGDNTHAYGGSHKIDLKNEYYLEKGEKYSIVLTMTHVSEDGTSAYTSVIPYATSVFPYGGSREKEITAAGVVNKGESYLFSGGKWTDFSEIKNDYTQTLFDEHSRRKLPENFRSGDKDGIFVDNYLNPQISIIKY